MVLCWLILALVAAGGPTETPRVPDELFRQAQDRGHVRVIVKIARDEAAGESIAAAQDAVLIILAGTHHRLLQRYVNSAFLALDVAPDALAALARSPKVESVAADVSLQPQVPEGTP